MEVADAPEIEFVVQTPVDDGTLERHVRAAMEMGLPVLSLGGPRIEAARLTVLANGPSARRAPRTGPTLALNGALSLFTDAGEAPTYWAACDPQELVADFLAIAPTETTYLVASKCHPRVFDRLRDHRVIVWHGSDEATQHIVPDPVLSAISITMCVFEIGERLGYSGFDVWGWDACFMDGAHHARERDGDSFADVISVECGEWAFVTTPTWALEAQSAVELFRAYPRDVRIHGNGLIGAALAFGLPGTTYDVCD